MGVLSTMEITRADALKEIRLATDRLLDELPNDKLADLMEALFAEKTCHNFMICEKYEGDGWLYSEGCLD